MRAPVTVTGPPRSPALDLLRGFTIAAMIVVNNPGNWNRTYRPLTHSAWHGATFADLIFPAFIFIMGASIALARRRSLEVTGWSRYQRVVTRALTLIAIGLVLNLASAWPEVWVARWPGVLQRIGLTYACSAVIVLTLSNRGQWMVTAALLAAHSGLLVWPQGGGVEVALAPGTNTAALVDRWVFGSHLLSAAGDPEGLLGVLTSIATALIGAATGRSLVNDAGPGPLPHRWPLPTRLAVVGALAVGIGYGWSFALPLNKPLWTGSFAVFASGTSMLGLAACVRLAQTPSIRLLAPFAWLGRNPLVIYAFSDLTANLMQRAWLVQSSEIVAPKDLIYWSWLVPLIGDAGGPWSSLIYAVGYTAIWIAVAGLLRWRGIRLRA